MKNGLKRRVLFVVIVGSSAILFDHIYEYFGGSGRIIRLLFFMLVASISYRYIIYKKV